MHCGGGGYLRVDVAPGHPDFGKLEICTCRNRDVAEQVRDRLFSISHLDELTDLTFESFLSRGRKGLGDLHATSIEMAFNQSRVYAQSLKGWLLLQGAYGCGKTHLAAAIANYRASLGAPPLFIMVPDLLDHLRATFSPKSDVSYDRRFDEIRTAPLLVLDDLGTQSMTPWVREKLYQLFTYRYNAELPTVITTADTLDEIDERIRSRLLDKRLCKIHALTVPAFYGATKKKR